MNPLYELAEQRIREAIDRGELEGLPGEGQPLQLDDDAMVPEELRVGYRLLKNANCLPPELAAHAEIRSLEELLSAAGAETTTAERQSARRRLKALRHQVSAQRGESPLWADPTYQSALLDRLDRGDGNEEPGE